MRHLILLGLASILSLTISAADAAKSSNDPWHLVEANDPATGAFNYCAVESDFDNGLSLAFARNKDRYTNIVLGFPDKRLQAKTKYKMLVEVDNKPPRDIEAFTVDETVLFIPLQHDKQLIGWVRKGKMLELKGPEDAIKFALDGVGPALDKLEACVDSNLKKSGAPVKSVLATKNQPTPAESLAAAAPAGVADVPKGSSYAEPLPLPKNPVITADNTPATEVITPDSPVEAPVKSLLATPSAEQTASTAVEAKPSSPAAAPDIITPRPEDMAPPARVADTAPQPPSPAESVSQPQAQVVAAPVKAATIAPPDVAHLASRPAVIVIPSRNGDVSPVQTVDASSTPTDHNVLANGPIQSQPTETPRPPSPAVKTLPVSHSPPARKPGNIDLNAMELGGGTVAAGPIAPPPQPKMTDSSPPKAKITIDKAPVEKRRQPSRRYNLLYSRRSPRLSRRCNRPNR